MAGLSDLTLGQIGTVGGATVGGLGAGAAYQSMQDIKSINQMAKMGNYGPHNPMPQSFMDKLKGAYTPSSVFKQTGYPTGFKNWFFSRSSPEHFGPVEQTMKFAKNIPGYAMKGLGYLASLPAQAALMTLHSTPANAAEVGMTAKDFQNLALQNQSKGPLYVDPNLSYEDFPLTEFEKELRYTPKGQREEIYNEMLGKLEGMTDVEKKDYLHYSPTDANLSGIPYDFEKVRALEYTDDPVFEDYYETGEHWSPGIPGIQRFKQQQLMNKRKQNFQNIVRREEAAKQKAAADAAAAAKATSSFDPSGPTQASIRRDRADKSGRGHRGGFTNPGKGSYGPHKADGGLIDFFRYGGFIG